MITLSDRQRLNAERKRRHIEQHDVLHGPKGCLPGWLRRGATASSGNSARYLARARRSPHQPADQGHAICPPTRMTSIELGGREARIRQYAPARRARAFDDRTANRRGRRG